MSDVRDHIPNIKGTHIVTTWAKVNLTGMLLRPPYSTNAPASRIGSPPFSLYAGWLMEGFTLETARVMCACGCVDMYVRARARVRA